MRPILMCAAAVVAAGISRCAEIPFKNLKWRLTGPFRGGRATAVAGVIHEPQVYYFGATGGGVWKSTDGGFNVGGRHW